MSAQGGIAGYPPSPYILNLLELQNTVTNASGLTGTSALTAAVTDLQKMVDFQKKQVNANFLASYDTEAITVLSNMDLRGTLSVNGTDITGGGGSGGNSLVAGKTAIVLLATSTPAISFKIQARSVFSFDQTGNALYYDSSGLATSFRISSATLFADGVAFNNPTMTPAPGKFLASVNSNGTGTWSYVSTMAAGNTNLRTVASNDSIRFTTNSLERARFTNAGYLGINTTTPLANLDVNGTIRTSGLQLTTGAAPGKVLESTDVLGNAAWTYIQTSTIQASNASVIVDPINDSILFETANTTRAIINSAGNFGINTLFPSYTLDVNGTANATNLNTNLLTTPTIQSPYGVINTVGSINASNYVVTASYFFGTGLYTTSDNLVLYSGSNLTIYANVDSYSAVFRCFGDMYAYNYYNLSDSNLKKNIRPFTYQETDTILDSIQGVHFQWKKDDTEDVGLIAQEIQEVLPEAVKKTDQGLNLAYTKLIPVLVESVKGLKSRVSALENEIAEIKSRLPSP